MDIKKYFDDFTFNSRVKPILTLALPIIAIAIYKGIIEYDLKETGIIFILSIILITFGAYIIRELGKTYEEKMYKELGAKPTTIVLRFDDDKIDMVSKIRYHAWINRNYKDINLPMTIEEEKQDEQCNNKYSSAINILRTTANSDHNKFFRVYQELKKYNYWRNLYGGKWYALCIYLLIILRQIINIKKIDFILFLNVASTQYTILICMICWTVIFCGVVTKKTVLRNAFDYAKTLIEIIEIFDKDNNN